MRRIYSLITIIIVFLCFAFFRENNGFVTKQRVPRVDVSTLMRHPALDEAYKGYVDELAKEGYHNGKNIKIEYQNVNGDQSNLKTMTSELVDDNSAVLFGITIPAAQALANSITRTPVVPGAIIGPGTTRLARNNQRLGGNTTGVSDQVPIRE